VTVRTGVLALARGDVLPDPNAGVVFEIFGFEPDDTRRDGPKAT
jgi:hypothetical protein